MTKLVLTVGEEVPITLTRDGSELTFTLTEEDLGPRPILEIDPGDLVYPGDYVQASMADPSCATIVENRVIGQQQGKTTLRLYVDDTILEWPVTVSSK